MNLAVESFSAGGSTIGKVERLRGCDAPIPYRIHRACSGHSWAMASRLESEWTPTEGSWASSAANRRSMTGNRSRDTGPELAVRSLLHRRGLRYWVARRPVRSVRRAADLVFPRIKLAVFIDGCFWHECAELFVLPKTNTDYWREKISGNSARDRQTNELLANEGWTVLRYWEHENPESVAEEIAERVSELRATAQGQCRLDGREMRATAVQGPPP
jgi:DNA mismatch endonuclease (patch repair protein)